MPLHRAVNLFQSVSHPKLIRLPISSHSSTMLFPQSLLSSLTIHLSSSCFLTFSFLFSRLFFHFTFFLFHPPHLSRLLHLPLPFFSIPRPHVTKNQFQFLSLFHTEHYCVCPWPNATVTFLVRSRVCGGGLVIVTFFSSCRVMS